LLVIAPEFPHRLARESAGLQSVQIFLGHLHRRDDIGPGALGHLDPLGIDQVGVLQAA
jgi:hypothetical protein